MTQTQQPSTSDRIGWLGVGRMGYAMAMVQATRLCCFGSRHACINRSHWARTIAK